MTGKATIRAREHVIARTTGLVDEDAPLPPLSSDPKKPKMGRPKGSKSRMLDLAHKLYSTNGEKVLRKIIDIALEDGNPNQMQALKLCADRIAPVSFFEDVAKAGSGNQINIQVNVVQPDAPKLVGGDYVDVEIKTLEVDDR